MKPTMEKLLQLIGIKTHHVLMHKKVCKVQMDGCMGTVRNNEKWGQIVKLQYRIVSGGPPSEELMALVCWERNDTTWCGEWTYEVVSQMNPVQNLEPYLEIRV